MTSSFAVLVELKEHGLSLQHTIFVHMFLMDMAHFTAANAAYSAHFSVVEPPSRACVQVRLQSINVQGSCYSMMKYKLQYVLSRLPGLLLDSERQAYLKA